MSCPQNAPTQTIECSAAQTAAQPNPVLPPKISEQQFTNLQIAFENCNQLGSFAGRDVLNLIECTGYQEYPDASGGEYQFALLANFQDETAADLVGLFWGSFSDITNELLTIRETESLPDAEKQVIRQAVQRVSGETLQRIATDHDQLTKCIQTLVRVDTRLVCPPTPEAIAAPPTPLCRYLVEILGERKIADFGDEERTELARQTLLCGGLIAKEILTNR